MFLGLPGWGRDPQVLQKELQGAPQTLKRSTETCFLNFKRASDPIASSPLWVPRETSGGTIVFLIY